MKPASDAIESSFMNWFALRTILLVLGATGAVPANALLETQRNTLPSGDVAIKFESQFVPKPNGMISKNVHWGLMFTTQHEVSVEETMTESGKKRRLNVPVRADDEYLNSGEFYLGLKNGETVELKIKPGTYDWLILVDNDGKGHVDGYLGSDAGDVQLSRFPFRANHTYHILIHSDSTPSIWEE
jgi:hypothetical protein